VKQLPDYGDSRTLDYCAFCGGRTGTRDHCPSRVFLDTPYPENLPIVFACSDCNGAFSLDEEYLACLIACVTCGSTDPEVVERAKVARILADKAALRARIESARLTLGDTVAYRFEHDRVNATLTKLAQGHALYELHASFARPPASLDFQPLRDMGEAARAAFESSHPFDIWPEVGSRAMQRAVTGADTTRDTWIVVQPCRYRYRVSLSERVTVGIVVGEYLACEARWD
jgi:hypothetical protein